MNTYKLSKYETHQMLIKSKMGLSPYSALNRFIVDFEISDSIRANNREEVKQDPTPTGLINSMNIILQPHRLCEILLDVDGNYTSTEFSIKDNKVVEYGYDSKGTNFIHEIVDRDIFLNKIVDSFTNNFKPKEQFNKSKLLFEFSFEEYIVMVSILILEKDKEILQLINEDEFPVITKSRIIEFIKSSSQFDRLWSVALIGLIDIDSFIGCLDEEVDKLVSSLISKEYLTKNQSTQIISLTQKIYPLLNYIKSFIQSTITIYVEKYPIELNQKGYRTVSAILFSETTSFKVLIRNKKLYFHQLYSKEHIKDVFDEIIFQDSNIPDFLQKHDIPKKSREESSEAKKGKTIFCSNCGLKLNAVDKFCKNCGNKL